MAWLRHTDRSAGFAHRTTYHERMTSPAHLRRSVSRLALLTVVAAAPTGRALATNAPVPHRPVLFHVSFDTDAITDDWPRAERAAGAPGWLNRPGRSIALDPEGAFGQAVRWVPPRTVLGWDAAHNLRSEQGTIAFWLKVGDNAATEQSHLVIVYGMPQPLYFGHPFLRLDFERWTAGLDFNGARRELIRNAAGLKRDTAGKWVHWAVCWNARRGAFALYVDGERLIRNPTDEPWLPERALDQIGLGNRVGPHQVWGLSPLEKSFDELWVFDRPLTRAEIITLRDRNVPPRDEAPPPPPSPDELLRFRRLETGLAKPASLPELRCGSRAHRVTWPFIRRARSVRADIHKVLDGKHLEYWPLFSGWTYSNGRERLNLELDEHDGFDWVYVKGSINGRLFAGTPDEMELRLEHPTTSHWMEHHWIRLERPLSHRRVTVTRMNQGRIDEIRFVRLEATDASDATPSTTYRLRRQAEPHEKTVIRYEPWDRTTLELTPDALSDRPEPMKLPTGRLLHLQSAPFDDDGDVGSTRITFAFDALEDGTAMHLELIDPVYEMRRLCTFEATLRRNDDPRTLDLHLDHRDLKIRRGRRLWWIACFDRDVALDLHRSTLTTYRAAPRSDQFVTDQVGAIRDLYNLLATGDPSQVPGDPRRTRRSLDELLTMAEDVHHFAPEHALARAVIRRTGRHRSKWTPEARARHVKLPAPDDTLPDDGAPRWARAGRAALKALRRHPDWWISERQAPNGEFGASANDDCDLVGDWTGLALIGDPDRKIRNADLRLCDYVWRNTLDDGVSRRTMDLTHAYEEGTSMLPRTFLLHYGDPVLFERNFGPARFFMHTLTGVNAAGHRHLRSDTFGRSELLDREGHRQDIMSFEPGTPALLVAWYNGHPDALAAIREHVDAWLDHARPGEGRFRRSFWGAHPVDFESDEHKPGRVWSLRNAINPHLFFMYEQNGDPRYCAYLLYHWRHRRTPWGIEMNRYEPESPSWYRLLQARGVDLAFADDYLLNPKHPLANPHVGGKHDNQSRPFALRYLVSADKAHLVEGVMDAWRFMLEEGPMVTEAGLQADRVSIKGQMALSEMFLGGVPDATRYLGYWYHAVSWESCGDDVSRFVLHHDDRSIKVLLYSFEPAPTAIGMRVWRLRPGRYAVRFGTDDDGDDVIDEMLSRETHDVNRFSRLDFTIPPRRTCVIELRLDKAAASLGPRPDLAISHLDCTHDPKTGALTVLVHNIGVKESGPFTVELRRDGEALTRKRFENLSAPMDLRPSIVPATFNGVVTTDGIEVRVEPEEGVREITRVNNQLRWAAP